MESRKKSSQKDGIYAVDIAVFREKKHSYSRKFAILPGNGSNEHEERAQEFVIRRKRSNYNEIITSFLTYSPTIFGFIQNMVFWDRLEIAFGN